MIKHVLYSMLVFSMCCVIVPMQTVAADIEGNSGQQHVRTHHERVKLTQKQRAQFGKIRQDAGPALKEKRHDLRVAEREYAKAVAEGRDSQAAKAQAVHAYGALLDAEASVRQELKAAGLPADMPLGKRPSPRRGKKEQNPDKLK